MQKSPLFCIPPCRRLISFLILFGFLNGTVLQGQDSTPPSDIPDAPPNVEVPDDSPPALPGDPPDIETPTPPDIPFSFLENVSSVGTTGISATDDIRIGFIIEGTGTADIVFRARAQSINFANADRQARRLQDPGMSIFSSSAGDVIRTADNYTTEDLSAIDGNNKYIPANVADSDAILLFENLDAGGYTMTIPSNSGEEGLVNGEAFIFLGETAPEDSTVSLSNVSTFARTSDAEPLLVGFIITGDTPVNLVCRGRGATVAPNNPNITRISDPRIDLFSAASGEIVASNDDYQDDENINLILGTNFIPGNITDNEAIMTILNLPPGGYSLRVTDAGGETGICIGEVFFADDL